MSAPTPAEIKSARAKVGLTQTQAAALLDFGQVSWARYESGARSLRAHEWRYWLHVAGILRIPFGKK